MGLKPAEVKTLYLRDFNLMLTGYFRRQEREWNHTRHVLSMIYNRSGFGTAEPMTPQSIFPLSMDSEDQKKPIRTLKQAFDLYKEFQN